MCSMRMAITPTDSSGRKTAASCSRRTTTMRIGKIGKSGKITYPYTGLNVSGSLAMNSKGTLFVLNRGYGGLSGTAHDYASIEVLAPQKKVFASKDPNGDPLDCIGGVLNDAVADSKGGVYFTMAGLYYAAADGKVTKQDAKDGNPPLATNGIILTPDEKHVLVAEIAGERSRFLTSGPMVNSATSASSPILTEPVSQRGKAREATVTTVLTVV